MDMVYIEGKDFYCEYCGAKLDLTLKRAMPRFDMHTGEEVFHYYHYWKCPNKKGWDARSHDEFNDDPGQDLDY